MDNFLLLIRKIVFTGKNIIFSLAKSIFSLPQKVVFTVESVGKLFTSRKISYLSPPTESTVKRSSVKIWPVKSLQGVIRLNFLSPWCILHNFIPPGGMLNNWYSPMNFWTSSRWVHWTSLRWYHSDSPWCL